MLPSRFAHCPEGMSLSQHGQNNENNHDNHNSDAGTSARQFQSLQQGALSHEQLTSESASRGTGTGTGTGSRNGDYTQQTMASTTEAYTDSDPTQAEDGLFLNPSNTLILNGSRNLDFDHYDFAIFGFAAGDNQFDGTYDLEAGWESELLNGEQHLNNLQSYHEVQLHAHEGNDLGVDLDADFEACFLTEVSGAEEQPAEHEGLDFDLEADFEAAFEDFDAVQAAEKGKQLREDAHSGKHEGQDLHADLEPAFEKSDAANSFEEEEEITLDDDLEALFSPEDDEISLQDPLPPDPISKAFVGQETSAVTTKGVEAISKSDQAHPLRSFLLPSRPIATENDATPPCDQAASRSVVPAVAHTNGLISTTEHLPTPAKRSRKTRESSLQIVDEASQLFLRTFQPDVPVEPAKKKPKFLDIPISSKQPDYFQMDKFTFKDFEKLAKAFILDPKHPDRRRSGTGNVQYHRLDLPPTISQLRESTMEFIVDGAGERFFGVRSSNFATRKLKWPENKIEIVDFVLPLFRRFCKNENQRLYAKIRRDNIKAAKASGAKVATPKKRPRGRQGRLPPDGDMSHSPSKATTVSLEETARPAYSTEQSGGSQLASPASFIDLTANQSFSQQSPDFTPLKNSDLRFSINFVLHHANHSTVRPKIALDSGSSPSYLNMINFIQQNTSDEYSFRSLCLHGPNGLVNIVDEENWQNVLHQISEIDWMEKEARCVAGLESNTSRTQRSHPEVIVID